MFDFLIIANAKNYRIWLNLKERPAELLLKRHVPDTQYLYRWQLYTRPPEDTLVCDAFYSSSSRRLSYYLDVSIPHQHDGESSHCIR